MPELPEVETWRALACRASKGLLLSGVNTTPDDIVYDQQQQAAIRNLAGRSVQDVRRHGKHMWFDLGDRFLYLHFGMTGSLSHLRPGEPSPSHVKLTLELMDNSRLVYRCVRRIGRIRLLNDPYELPSTASLGPDPYLTPLSASTWRQRFHNRKSPIKSVLLDQKVVAGIGNWLADDILYAARINPFTPANQLMLNDCKRLSNACNRILTKAVEAQADETYFPAHWIFHQRWNHNSSHNARGERLTFDRIGGRTTVWAPARQGNR